MQPRIGSSSSPDLRRVIPRPLWLTNRARNALRRPVFIGAISAGTFVTAIVSMVVVPRAQRQPVMPQPVALRPDTIGVLGNVGLAQLKLREADSALDVAHRDIAAAAAAAATLATDTVAMANAAARDSIDAGLERLDALIKRAEQAPLPASYRALAQSPELRADPRVAALVDSLGDIEREREGFGSVGGVDPIFVALTSRATEMGHAIQEIAVARRAELASQRALVAGADTQIAAAPPIDTTVRVAERDSLRQAIRAYTDSLARMRAVALAMDLEEDRARERASAVAPPLALLASAFVLSAVIGFAVAFVGELRRPRVGDARELERLLGVRVLSTLEASMPSVDRGRRSADRAAPPYFDPGAEGYQLAYLGLATGHPPVLMTVVSGDDPTIAAIVACNLAAIAADEARNALIVDLDPTCSASAALRSRVTPGIADLVAKRSSWPDATVSASVGRNKTVDLVPYGTGSTPDAAAIAELLKTDTARLARYYDAIVFHSPETELAEVTAALPAKDVIFCARPGMTPLSLLKERLDAIRAAGAVLRGVVLWEAPQPLLPVPTEVANRTRKRTSAPRELATAPR